MSPDSHPSNKHSPSRIGSAPNLFYLYPFPPRAFFSRSRIGLRRIPLLLLYPFPPWFAVFGSFCSRPCPATNNFPRRFSQLIFRSPIQNSTLSLFPARKLSRFIFRTNQTAKQSFPLASLFFCHSRALLSPGPRPSIWLVSVLTPRSFLLPPS